MTRFGLYHLRHCKFFKSRNMQISIKLYLPLEIQSSFFISDFFDKCDVWAFEASPEPFWRDNADSVKNCVFDKLIHSSIDESFLVSNFLSGM